MENLKYIFKSQIPKSRKNKIIKDRIRKIRYLIFGNLPFLGRKRSFGETHKAKNRRERERFFDKYCNGHGLDIGYGGDPITENSDGWDFEHGDAQLLKGINDETYDFVYSSHLLEHLPDPCLALTNWWRVLKRGGYLIIYIPHRDLYEKKKELPSRFNDDHKHFFLPEYDDPPDTIGVVSLINKSLNEFEIIYCKTCNEDYINPGPNLQSKGEYSIEVVIRKLNSIN